MKKIKRQKTIAEIRESLEEKERILDEKYRMFVESQYLHAREEQLGKMSIVNQKMDKKRLKKIVPMYIS